MCTRLFPILLLLAASGAKAADFDGRWILPTKGDPRGRVWWLKVDGANAEFVGAPGGQLDAVTKLTRSGDELLWEVKENKYRAKLEGGRLTGREETGPQRTFSGGRAPEIKDKDDGRWMKQKAIELFNGKDLTGWRVTVPNRSIDEWKVADGVLRNGTGKAPDIATLEKFWNFELHLEFRVAQKSNSGVGLRGRYEVQINGDYGEPLSLHSNGALYSRIMPAVNATLAPDQWQAFAIRFIGRDVTVKLNGKTLINKKEVEGYTALATDVNEDQPGPLMLQGDHGPVEFRKVTMTPLARR
jgi:Domain of Unknown Function (DUF1080)